MDEMSYPKITKHKQFHKKCSDYIMQINIPKLKQEPATELRKIEEEVQSWVMDHVLNEDMEMAKAYLAYRKQWMKVSRRQPKRSGRYLRGLCSGSGYFPCVSVPGSDLQGQGRSSI